MTEHEYNAELLKQVKAFDEAWLNCLRLSTWVGAAGLFIVLCIAVVGALQ